MATPKTSEDELKKLREEVALLRAEREELNASSDGSANADSCPSGVPSDESAIGDDGTHDWASELQRMARELEPHAESAVKIVEESTRKHPLLALTVALVGGIALSNLLSRK
tara:strand:+ start:2496 stop:2831 length:336 start_codon:yes stop_codon:yes gene_type:complete